MPRRRVAVSLTIASVVAGGIVGAYLGVPSLSGAASNTSTGAPPAAQLQHDRGGPGRQQGGPTAALDAAAKALGMTTDELRDRLKDGTTSIADIAHEKNIDVNAVIDAIAADQRQRIEEFVNNPLRMRGGGAGHGPGAGARVGGGEKFDAAAKALGISTDELWTALRDGKSIADIAGDKGVDVQKVIDDMVAAATQQIDKAQQAGRLTDEQATRLKDGLAERITSIVNGDFHGPGRGGGPFRGHRGP
jgi:hypothetical protein